MTADEAIAIVNDQLWLQAGVTSRGDEVRCYTPEPDENGVSKTYLSASDCRLLAGAFATLATSLGGDVTQPTPAPCPNCGGSGYGPDRIEGPGDVYQDRCETCDGFGLAEPFPAEAAIVRDIEKDILDRRGLSHELSACDDSIRDEIRRAWLEIVRKHLPAVSP